VPREYQSELNRAGSRVISVPSMRGTLNPEHVSYSNGRFRYVLPLALSWTVQLLAGRPLFKQISSAFRLTSYSDVPVSLNYFQREVARYLVSVYPRPCEDESFEIAALSSVDLQDIRASFSNIHPIRTESLERRCILSPSLSLSLSSTFSFDPFDGRWEKRSRLSVFRAEFQIDAAIRGISRSTGPALGAIGVTVYA